MCFQESITAENTLAYKSLVEDPKELMFMAPIDTSSDLDKEDRTATMPRIHHDAPLDCVPQSNKAATLSKLLRKSKDPEQAASSSPLKILREIGKPRLKILPSVGSESVTSTTFLLDHDGENPCETPSYMANAQGNFTLSIESNASPPETTKAEDNPLPLPPRNRANLQLNVAQKRHVRKYPLIIPATGIQRTLDKINQVTPVEEKQDVFPVPAPHDEIVKPIELSTFDDDDDDDDVFEELKNGTKISQDFEQNVNHYGTIRCDEKNYTKSFIENNFPSTKQRHSLIDLQGPRTYENLESFQKRFSYVDEADTASLHFESILENDDNVANISDDMVDGFCVFETNNKPSTSNEVSIKKPERKSLAKAAPSTTVIESKKLEFSQKYPKYKMPRNELASNALFNKIKESVENASMVDECEVELELEHSECELKKSINHVSCEDLLDFSEKKPKGRERGAESDEVRIMIKMFGTKVSSFTKSRNWFFGKSRLH